MSWLKPGCLTQTNKMSAWSWSLESSCMHGIECKLEMKIGSWLLGCLWTHSAANNSTKSRQILKKNLKRTARNKNDRFEVRKLFLNHINIHYYCGNLWFLREQMLAVHCLVTASLWGQMKFPNMHIQHWIWMRSSTNKCIGEPILLFVGVYNRYAACASSGTFGVNLYVVFCIFSWKYRGYD